jgi:hypothetical protein
MAGLLRRALRAAVFAAGLLLAGCSTIFPRVEVADTAPPAPAVMTVA